MKTTTAFTLFGVIVLGCDPGPELLKDCEAAFEQLPDKKLTDIPWATATAACTKLAQADSELSSKGQELLEAIPARKAAAEAAALKAIEKERERRQLEEEKKIAEKAAALAAAKKVVRISYLTLERDGSCTGKGLPPYRKIYEGGTFEQDELVAETHGCIQYYKTHFCCPDP